MTDRELRRLGRGDLIEILYQYQRREQQLEEQNAELRRRLEERSIRIEQAGSIAEAALSLNRVFESAQAAADQYLEEVQARAERYLAEIRTRASGAPAEEAGGAPAEEPAEARAGNLNATAWRSACADPGPASGAPAEEASGAPAEGAGESPDSRLPAGCARAEKTN